MTIWDPWLTLRAHADIVFRFDPIAALAGGAIYARRGTRAAIVIDPRLSPVERTAALAHELVHHERGGGCDHPGMGAQWAAVVAREEARVEQIVARRLVPTDALVAFVAEQVALDEAVTAASVAEYFQVPVALAEVALREARN